MINVDFKTKAEIIAAFPNESSCLTHLEKLRWNGFVVSPFDALSTVYNCAENRYRCKNSGKYFNAKTATMFHNSKVPLQKWFLAIWIMTRTQRNITSVSLAHELQLTQKTAWYLQQRILQQLDIEKIKKIKKKPSKKNAKSVDINAINVVADKDRMPMHEWLQLLKK